MVFSLKTLVALYTVLDLHLYFRVVRAELQGDLVN